MGAGISHSLSQRYDALYVCYVKPKAILGILTAHTEKMTIASVFVSEGERKHSEGRSLYASDQKAGEETELVVAARPFRL